MISIESLTRVEWVVLGCGYIFLFVTSGTLVRRVGSYVKGNEGNGVGDLHGRAGRVTGKCENLLIFPLVLSGSFTALAVIFAAEGLIKLKHEDENYPLYHLSGTMVNFTYSVLISLLVYLVIKLDVTDSLLC